MKASADASAALSGSPSLAEAAAPERPNFETRTGSAYRKALNSLDSDNLTKIGHRRFQLRQRKASAETRSGRQWALKLVLVVRKNGRIPRVLRQFRPASTAQEKECPDWRVLAEGEQEFERSVQRRTPRPEPSRRSLVLLARGPARAELLIFAGGEGLEAALASVRKDVQPCKRV